MMSRAQKDLTTFASLSLPDLRDLDGKFRREPLPEITAAKNVDEAIALLEFHMGFTCSEIPHVLKPSKIGEVKILRVNLTHIVEKRREARERYILLALDTLQNPYEIWETLYDDDLIRFIFIGVYAQRQQMLTIVAPWDGKVLWNFMHTDMKSLNKHRLGKLIYQR